MVGVPRTVTAATSTSLVVVPVGLASTRLVVPVLVPAALARRAIPWITWTLMVSAS